MDTDGLGAIVVILVICATVAFGVSAIFLDFGLDSGAGEQIGYISEVENNGWIWRPTEIRLISINPVYSSEDTSWHYATTSPEITRQAKGFMKNHTPVTVSYEVRTAVPRWDYANRVVITDIKPAEV